MASVKITGTPSKSKCYNGSYSVVIDDAEVDLDSDNMEDSNVFFLPGKEYNVELFVKMKSGGYGTRHSLNLFIIVGEDGEVKVDDIQAWQNTRESDVSTSQEGSVFKICFKPGSQSVDIEIDVSK